MRYFLSLGSNLGDRKNNLERAIGLLIKAGVHIVSTSSLYETEPVGIVSESWFYNQVVEVETVLIPEELLLLVKHIEDQMDRIQTKSLSSRPIDVDILLAGEKTVNTEILQIPHPRMIKRNFVLYPLAEIAPDVKHPVLDEKIIDILKRSKDRFCVKKL
jgi:2-amino-4-hydroxy-6-hydroxymethyldihydropteridine diphosphokinase